MRRKLALSAAAVVGGFGLAVATAQLTLAQGSANLDTAAIEEATGLKGQLIAEESVSAWAPADLTPQPGRSGAESRPAA